MNSSRILIPFLLFFLSARIPAQVGISGVQESSPEKLAMMYFEQMEYDKALIYLEDLYERSPDVWYNYYFRSLMETKELRKAEKLVKKQLKRHPGDVYNYVHLGMVYKLEGDGKKEQEAYEKAIKELVPAQPEIQMLANAFMEQRLYDHALAVYNKAAKNSPYPYYYEKADIYKAKNDLSSMINQYLDALEFRESELEIVKRNLQNSLGYGDDDGGFMNPLLKNELQKRIVKYPDKIVFTEFLIFIQIQQKDFDGAFVQERALDKRLKREGYKIYELARICVSNGNYETARRCYNYLTEKGEGSVYYDLAIIDGLSMDYLILTRKPATAKEEFTALEQKLEKAHQKYRSYSADTTIVRNLASIKAWYLGKNDEAIELLIGFTQTPALNPATKARFKLMLADIQLTSGDIWEASLLYSQVEKDFKHDAIGFDAKFRNARLSFYAGDFAWAKTQADVLKGATSKLTANDALDLSLIISDAIGVDTNEVPLRMFASADLLILQHRYEEAIARMDSINLLFGYHTLGDDIYFRKAGIYSALGKYKEAAEMYRNILEFYPGELYGDDAQFKLAELYENNLGDTQSAGKAYEDVLTKYPGSIYTVEARRRFRILRGDNLSN